MSKPSTRHTGQKRKHDEISATPSPAVPNMPNAWNGTNPQQFDPNAFQNGSYYPQQYDPQQIAYAMQQQQRAHAVAMADAASNVAASQNAAAQRQTEAGAVDRTSVNQLKDAMSMGGISLREEEAYAHGKREIPTSSYTGDRTLSQNFFPDDFVVKLFRLVAKHYSIKAIHPDVIALAGLAVEQRVRSLVEKVNSASQHRWETQTAFSAGVVGGGTKRDDDDEGEGGERVALYADGKTPVFDRAIRKDVGKQLMAIEKLEKAEEMRIRRERKEKQEQAKQSGGATTAATPTNGDPDDDDGPPKKRKKRAEGPGVQAKNMSEETKKKLSNTIANAAAGFGNRYAWMNTGSTPLPRRPTGGGGGGAGGSGANAGVGGWGGWSTGKKGKKKQSERSLSMRDVLFVVEREKGHGAGRGSARGWS